MRKLKLQVQMSVNGFVGGTNGELDWMTWNWGDDIKNYVNKLHEPVDTILLGRKMTDGFVSHWTNAKNNPADESYEFGKKMIDTPKVVFTKTLDKSVWDNTVLAKGDLSEEVNNLKNKKGNDIIVYGGASFVSSLVKANLIDEYYLFVNPAAIGSGLTIFGNIDSRLGLKLVESIPFDCGIVLQHYEPLKN